MPFTLREASFITTAVNSGGYPPEGPPEVAFAGRSNVGKSSLINTLTARRKLVRVSGRPGCTQQINFFSINQDELRLVDLPGYGFAKVPVEVKNTWRKMIEGYLTRRPTLKAVVVILDIRRDPGDEDLMLLEWLHSYQVTTLVALTKLDKLSKNQAASRLAKIRRDLAQLDPQPTGFSSQTGQGRDELWQRIIAAAGLEEGEGAGE